MTALSIAVDLGGTKTAAAVVDSSGAFVLPKVKLPTPGREGSAAMLDVMARAIDSCRDRIDASALVGIGVGTAGAVDTTTGRIVAATDTVSDWLDTDVLGGLRTRLPWASELPIHVQNDVDAHAVGECWHGAGAGAESMLMLAVGTGIGAAFCLDGQVMRGAHHMAGEVGRLRIQVDDELPPGRGTGGSFEQLAAGPAILDTYRTLGGQGTVKRGQDVMALALAGDALAEQVVVALGRRVGRVLAWLCLVLDPQIVVLGGGVPTKKSAWWPAMDAEVRAALPAALADVPIVRAKQRNNAALLGAAREAFRSAGVPTSAGHPSEGE